MTSVVLFSFLEESLTQKHKLRKELTFPPACYLRPLLFFQLEKQTDKVKQI